MPAVSGRVLFWLPHLQASYHLQSTFSSLFLFQCLNLCVLTLRSWKVHFGPQIFQTVSSSPPKKWVGHGQLDLPMDLPIVRSSEGSPSASSPSWWASASRQPSARLGSARARATASPRRHRGTETGRRRWGSGAWGRYREKHGETVYRIILVGDLEHFDFQILGIIIPTDYFFFRGVETTNQYIYNGKNVGQMWESEGIS